MLSQELLNELKIIGKEELGLELSQKSLSGIGNTFVSFFSLLRQIEAENEGKNENFRSPDC